MKIIIRKNFNLGFAVLLAVFLFQDAISEANSLFSYFDEIESVILSVILCIVLFLRREIPFDKYQKKLFFSFIFVIITGLIGNRMSAYQTMPYIAVDIFVYSKFLINILAIDFLIRDEKIRKYEDTAWKVSCISSLVLTGLVIHEMFAKYPIWPYMSDRYGVRSLKLFFSNQTYLALIGIMLLILHYYLGEHRQGKTFFIILDMLISASTFRTKALGFIAVAALIIFVFGGKRRITKLNLICMGIVIGFVALAVGYDYLNQYYLSGNEYSIRLQILEGGVELANMYKPFGTGFGTYCSLGAKLNYSEAYDLLGMRNMYLWDSMYDNLWASIIGQLGFAGTLFYLYFIFRLLVMIIQIRKISIRKFWAGILVCAYLVIASLGEASFNAFYVCFMGGLIGFLYNSAKQEKIENEMEQ